MHLQLGVDSPSISKKRFVRNYDTEILAEICADLYTIPAPGVTCGLSLLLVLMSLHRGIFCGLSGVTPFTKTNTPNSNLICTFDHHVMLKCALQVFKYLCFISFIIIVICLIRSNWKYHCEDGESNLCTKYRSGEDKQTKKSVTRLVQC